MIEGNNAVFTVTLGAAQATNSTVNYTIAGTGGAVLGTDTGASTPAPVTGTLTFIAGTTTQTIVVPTTADSLAETGEGVSVTLSVPSTGLTLGTATVTVAIADPAPGTTFALTQGLDNITGTTGNDTINAFLDGGSATFQGTDIVNGSDGVDTLTILGLNTAGAVSVANITNVEKFVLQSTNDSLTIDFSGTPSETSITSINNTGSATFSNISSASVALGVIGGTASKTQTFAFAATNATAAATLELNGAAGTVAITDNTAVKTVTVNGTGSNSTLGGFTLGASVTKLVLTGDKRVDIKATNLGAEVLEIDASANTAGVLIQQDQAIVQKITGSKGNDTIQVGDAATYITKDDTINGGDGTDTLVIKTAVTTAGATAKITNIEVLGLDGTSGAIAQDMDLFGYSTVTTSGTSRSHTLTNVLNNTVINLGVNATDFTTTLKTNSASDSQTFNIGGTAGGITATAISPDVRIENLTINSQGTAANTVTAISTAINNVKFTGATGLTLTSLANVTGVLDFTTMTAGVTVGSAASTAIGSKANQTINGTELADTFNIQNTGGAFDGVTVNAGSGNDTATIFSNTNATKLTNFVIDLGAGNDTLTVETNTGGSTDTITIKDGTGIDKINLGVQNATSQLTIQIAATNSNDGVWFDGLASAAAAAGTNISIKGGLLNGTGTSSASASVATDASSATTINTDLATVLTANSNSTVFVIQRNLTGDVSTALTNLATWVDAATLGTRADLLEAAIATAIGGAVTGLDAALSTTDKVVFVFDNGTHSALVYVTNTDTSVANTLTAAEIQVVGVVSGTAALAAQDFVA